MGWEEAKWKQMRKFRALKRSVFGLQCAFLLPTIEFLVVSTRQ